MNNYLIYKHTSPSGKSYIGQTNNLIKRNSRHKSINSGCIAFYNAIQKYTWETFTHEILAENLTIDEANILEEKFISDYDTIVPKGYNLLPGGYNRVQHEETKQKISFKNKGKVKPTRTIEHCQNISLSKKEQHISTNKGIPRSSETKLKISIAKKGVPKSEEHKLKISQNSARTGKPSHNKGKTRIINPETGKYVYILL